MQRSRIVEYDLQGTAGGIARKLERVLTGSDGKAMRDQLLWREPADRIPRDVDPPLFRPAAGEARIERAHLTRCEPDATAMKMRAQLERLLSSPIPRSDDDAPTEARESQRLIQCLWAPGELDGEVEAARLACAALGSIGAGIAMTSRNGTTA